MGGGGGEVGEEEEGEIIYLSPLHCHHQNDLCIKVGSDESHFNVSLIVRDKVTRQCPQTTTFEEKGEPKRTSVEPRSPRLPANVLQAPGQTGSHHHWFSVALRPHRGELAY